MPPPSQAHPPAHSPPPASGHKVAVLAHEGMGAFELGTVTEIFGRHRPDVCEDWYRLSVCVEDAAPVAVLGGAELRAHGRLDDLAAADTVVLPGVADRHGNPGPDVVDALRAAHARGARMVSICSGTFALAAAGLLDRRRATTHWRYADLLRERFPEVEVDPRPLYIDHGDVITGAGGAAALDVGLHLVRQDFGAGTANSLARRLVVHPQRDGGQAQFIESPVPVEPDDDWIGESMAWALANLGQPITVAVLAEKAMMAPRTYLRNFARCTGTSPIRWLNTQRVQASLPLLETSTTPVEQVARAVGFESSATFRHHFTELMRTSPAAYRAMFRREQEPERHSDDHRSRRDRPADRLKA
ncbi:helix-turn-helix domain-containing protein [Haloechinothrix sp. LS1_15]|uniref:helix-turn-helix domain-containing protein n=1 Tax=Haloechinothrix sp. LS1_15 TaxID=2652248 RepID=UPI002945703F|nr:helix-turn-helix domain-containing protein [Haloechinothrix sp. LS1_15]MDV6013581.1 helix-turn-helix domain-containing protein [Haloechinothrix sp. LS1_15]